MCLYLVGYRQKHSAQRRVAERISLSFRVMKQGARNMMRDSLVPVL